MASRKKIRVPAWVGSDSSRARDYAHFEKCAEEVQAAYLAAQRTIAIAWGDLNSGSASRAFKGKQALLDAASKIDKALVSAEIAASGLDRFASAYRSTGRGADAEHFAAFYKLTLESASQLRHTLTNATITKSPEEVREAIAPLVASQAKVSRALDDILPKHGLPTVPLEKLR